MIKLTLINICLHYLTIARRENFKDTTRWGELRGREFLRVVDVGIVVDAC